MTLPDASAFPHDAVSEYGLTKREFFVAAILPGILANPKTFEALREVKTQGNMPLGTWLGECAAQIADATLAVLAKEEK